MSSLFQGNATFNQPIGNWDTSNVTNMYFMFAGAPINQPAVPVAFNQDISHWNTGKVTNM